MSHLKMRPARRARAIATQRPRVARYDGAMARNSNVADHEAGKERMFLSAEWRDLVMLNYEVDPRLLREYVPRGTELDSFGGKALVSLVGFRFLRTKLFGWLPLPFHVNFDEVNLRFYVRRRADDGDRRGVVFIREIVPKRAVALLARVAYGENYSRYPMRHLLSAQGARKVAQYEWKLRNGKWARIFAECGSDPELSPESVRPPAGRWILDPDLSPRLDSPSTWEPYLPAEGSLEQFITEHYWGYSALPGSPHRGPGSPSLQRDGGTVEYHVTHPPWRVWQSVSAGFEGDGVALYGDALGTAVQRAPESAFIAEGSPVVVFAGRSIA